MVRDRNDTLQPCHALFDSGAQSTLVSEACVQRLHLTREFDKTLLYGLDNSNSNYTKGKVKLEIFTAKANRTIIAHLYCLSNLTQYIPFHIISNTGLDFFNNLELADPGYYKNRIDMIIGVNLRFHIHQDLR